MQGKSEQTVPIDELEQQVVGDPTNIDAMVQLAQGYVDTKRYFKAKDVLEQAIKVCKSDANGQKANLHLMAARTAEEIQDQELAFKHYTFAMKHDRESFDAVHGLARTLFMRDDWARSAKAYQMLLKRFPDRFTKDEQIDIHLRLAKAHEAVGIDDKAEKALAKALSLDKKSKTVLKAGIAFCERKKDFEKVIPLRKHLIKLLEDDERFNQWRILGTLYATELNNVEEAVDCFREALKLEPDNEILINQVAEFLSAIDSVPDLMNILEDCLANESDVDRRISINEELAKLEAKYGKDHSKTAGYLGAILDLDPKRKEVEKAIETILCEKECWADLDNHYMHMIRLRSADEPEKTEAIADYYFKLARLNVTRNDNERAAFMVAKALEANPESLSLTTDAIRLLEEANDYDSAVKYRIRRVNLLDDNARAREWRRIGDIHVQARMDVHAGLVAYRKALEGMAGDVSLLLTIGDLLVEQNEIDDALVVYNAALKNEEDEQAKISLNERLANLVIQHNRDNLEAIKYYDAVLDIDSTRSDMLDLAEGILLKHEAWNDLEKLYARMISRLDDNETREKAKLWNRLGERLINKAERLEDGLNALQIALGLDPDNKALRARVTNLKASVSGDSESAMEAHSEMLEQDPENVDSLLALWKLYFEQEKFDEAFCCASLVENLGRSKTAAAEFYKETFQDLKLEGIGQVTPKLWQAALIHPLVQHPVVGQILWMVFHHVKHVMPSDLKGEGILKKNKLDLEESITVCETLQTVHKTLDLPVPTVYLRPEADHLIEVLPIQPAGIAFGGDAFENFPIRRMQFLMGSFGTLARPDMAIALYLAVETIQAILEGVAAMFGYEVESRADRSEVKSSRKRLEKQVPKKDRTVLEGLVRDFAELKDFNLADWKKGQLFTAYRAGLVACNDPNIALQALEEHKTFVKGLPVEDIRRDLMLFSVSEAYFHLRKRLQLTVV